MNDMHNFSQAKQTAIEQLREMNKKAAKAERSPRQNGHNPPQKSPNNFITLGSNDDILIMGLILILAGDCHDKWLFLALLYILM